MGLVGFWKAGSFASTSTWVTTVATARLNPLSQEVVLQILLQGIADRALRIRPANIQRNFMQFVRGQF